MRSSPNGRVGNKRQIEAQRQRCPTAHKHTYAHEKTTLPVVEPLQDKLIRRRPRRERRCAGGWRRPGHGPVRAAHVVHAVAGDGGEAAVAPNRRHRVGCKPHTSLRRRSALLCGARCVATINTIDLGSARGERGTTAGGRPISPEAQTSVVNVNPYTKSSPGPIVEVIDVGVIVPPAMYNTLPRTEPATNCLAVGRLVPAIRDG